MKLVRLRFIADVLTGIILLMCMVILPIYILLTVKYNESLNSKMNEIEVMFTHLEQSHDLNAELIYETLEFRRIEYNCYLTKEAPEFLDIMDITLKNYTEYINNDTTLTAQQKQNLMVHIEKIYIAVEARKQLTNKLIEYDSHREYYLETIKHQLPNNQKVSQFKTILK